VILLVAAAVLGGALNAVAGGGSFLTLPALLSAGIAPVVANATSTLALWPGSVSSVVAYRADIRSSWRTLGELGVISVAGGLIGGLLLVRTSDTSFMRLLPWLMLLAAATFTFGGTLTARASRAHAADGVRFAWWALALQFAISVYGGYFGGGMGIMMLATLSVSGLTDIHEMNGLKSLLGTAINGVALAEFVIDRKIAWTPGLVMVLGAIGGGYFGALTARRIDRRHVRTFVIVVGWAMTVYFFAIQ
jgi:uncharacterized membrane protein YfcA